MTRNLGDLRLNQFYTRALSLLLTAVVLFSAAPGAAALTCKSLFHGRSARQLELSRNLVDGRSLLEIGAALRSRASEIDPRRTHVPELVVLLQQAVRQIELALLEKTHEKLYLTRKPLLEGVIQEINERIKNNQVTYEFSASLPLRIGWLLKMSEQDPAVLAMPQYYGPIPDIETSHYYSTRTYTTHENFMSALKKISEYRSPRRNGRPVRRPSLERFAQALNEFPSRIFLSAFFDLNIPDLNRLMAKRNFPLGNIRHPVSSRLDGIFFNEFIFPFHDLGHAMQTDTWDGEGINEEIVSTLEQESLAEVDRHPGRTQELWHVFHFLLFHEGIRYEYLSPPTLEGLTSLYVEQLKKDLALVEKRGAASEIYSAWIMALPGDRRAQMLEAEADKYLTMLRAQIFKNQSVLDLELLQIRLKQEQGRP